MLEHCPLRVQSRYRCYTTQRQRRDVDTLDSPYGRGTPLTVGLVTTALAMLFVGLWVYWRRM